MRSFIVAGVQALIGVGIAALVMPVLLAEMPAARASGVGPWILLGIGVVAFAILRLAWPRRLK